MAMTGRQLLQRMNLDIPPHKDAELHSSHVGLCDLLAAAIHMHSDKHFARSAAARACAALPNWTALSAPAKPQLC